MEGKIFIISAGTNTDEPNKDWVDFCTLDHQINIYRVSHNENFEEVTGIKIKTGETRKFKLTEIEPNST